MRLLPYALLFGTMAITLPASAQDFEPSAVWPLSGTSTPDAVASAFGPRQLASEGFRYDFHRGIDLAAPVGTPIHAVAAGRVRIAGEHPAYSDPLLQVRHYRPGHRRCSSHARGCYYTNYMHVSEWVVSPNERVEKGQLLGYTGTSESGFAHLHFEVRDGGLYQRDCVHPLRLLPYANSGGPRPTVSALELLDGFLEVTVNVVLPPAELDLESVEVIVFDVSSGAPLEVDRHAYEMERWNRQFTHKRSEGHAPDCPFAGAHPEGSVYDAHVHMDRAHFNAVLAEPERFNARSPDYRLTLTFDDLAGVPNAADLRVTVRATDARGSARELTLSPDDL